MVRSGSVTSSPKASPGCSGAGAARRGGTVFAPAPGRAARAKASKIGAAMRMHDIRVLRRLGAANPAIRGISHHAIIRLWPIGVYSPYKPGETRAKARTGRILADERLGALANQSFVKMNGVGNEIVVVDLRARGGEIAPRKRARRRRRKARPTIS